MLKKLISAILIFLFFFQISPSTLAVDNELIADTSKMELSGLPKKIVREIVDKREKKAKYFELDNNQIMKVDYPIAVHQRNDEGNWQDIFNKTNKSFIKFKTNGIRIFRDDYEISITRENSLISNLVSFSSNHKIYKSIYEDTDLEYKILGNKLEENLVLNSNNSPKEFIFNYYLKGLTVKQNDAKTIELMNKNQKCVYKISAPKMFDSNNSISENLSLKILKNEGNRLRVKIVCDENWIESNDRVFPVFIDPDYKDEFFDFTSDENGEVLSTNWRKKDTDTSVFLNLTGSDFKDFGVITVSVFGKNRNGELNCTYQANYYFLEAGRKYELYNLVNENGCEEAQIRFRALKGQHVCGKWSPDYLPESGVLRIGGSGGPGNVKDTEFSLIVSSSKACWTMIRTKANDSSVYLQLFDPSGHGGNVNCSIWGMGGKQCEENCTYHQNSYTLQFGKKYELFNLVKEKMHSGIQLRFESEPGTLISGKWSPDYVPESGCERIPASALSKAVSIRPIENPQVLIDVPRLSQLGEFPTGCESVSAVMVLHFYDYGISVRDFIDKYLVKKRITDHPDPNSAFVGSPYNDKSYGCFAPCIAKAMNKILKGAHAEVIRGKSLKALSEEYTKNNVPVLIWATMGMRKTRPTTTWTIGYTDENARYKKGEKFTWPGNEHCVVLVGFNEKNYFVNDPLQSKDKVQGAYEKNLLEARFHEQGSQAVVVKKESVLIPELSNQNVLKLGTRGEEVRYLQNMLLSMGYDIGHAGADGIFGRDTESAVRLFQKSNALSVDGKIGPKTVDKICKLVPHSLPTKGEPGSIGRQYDENGNLVRERIYGSDGNAEEDVDYGEHGGHPTPHRHPWKWENGKPDRGDPKPVEDDGKDNSKGKTKKFSLDSKITKSLFVAGAAVGTGYVIYRGVRMLPSMLPPLWWTIPGNLVIP